MREAQDHSHPRRRAHNVVPNTYLRVPGFMFVSLRSMWALVVTVSSSVTFARSVGSAFVWQQHVRFALVPCVSFALECLLR